MSLLSVSQKCLVLSSHRAFAHTTSLLEWSPHLSHHTLLLDSVILWIAAQTTPPPGSLSWLPKLFWFPQLRAHLGYSTCRLLAGVGLPWSAISCHCVCEFFSPGLMSLDWIGFRLTLRLSHPHRDSPFLKDALKLMLIFMMCPSNTHLSTLVSQFLFL